MNVRVVPHPVCPGIQGAPCSGALPTRTHLPQGKHPRLVPHRGGCRELPPPTRSGRDPGTCSGVGIVQLSHSWLCPSSADLPNPLSSALLMCPLQWAGVWELPDGVISPQDILVLCPSLQVSKTLSPLHCWCLGDP